MKRDSKQKLEKRTAYVVSHTHWDREWRYPIWETRLMLIDFMDELIKVIESGTYPGFLLDGQVIPIMDYLEIRPEMEDRIKALVTSGKLQIGPWVVLPDEYPIDGECLVRNLLLGRRKCEQFGGIFNVGYTSFGWGQTAQLPQIYAGFGIDVCMVGKRVSEKRAPKSEFIWRSPDGSELLTTRFGEDGRANFYFKAHLPALFGIAYESEDWRYDWSKGGIIYHCADRERMEQDHFRLDQPNCWCPDFITAELVERTWQTTDDSILDSDRLMMNGCDYSAAQKMFPEMLARFNEIDPDSQRRWIHIAMPQFIELMRQKIDRSKLTVVEGELRDGPAGPLTGNALTTCLHLKSLNKKAQNMLIRFAEPLSVTSAMAGAEFPENLLRKAWEFLLLSHPHDSINGVTQEKTVSDVTANLNHVIELSMSLGERAMQELVRRIDMSQFDDNSVLLVVFNPAPYPRREIIEAWLTMPGVPALNPTWVAYDPPERIQIFDAGGNPIDTQWAGYTTETYSVSQLYTRAMPYNCFRHRIFFDTDQLPAGGYKVFRAASVGKNAAKPLSWSDSQARTGSLLKNPAMIENEYLRVQMNPNGTFNLLDKQSGREFFNLNYYEDRGEHGDYWYNQRPMFDQVYTSLGCAARIWSEESGPLQASLVSEVAMLLPKRGIKEQKNRTEELAPLTIRTRVTLRAGQKHVEVNVEFENRHEDHYMRVMFPTELSDATCADVGGHFIIDKRSIRPQGPDSDGIWPDMATQPQNNFVDVSDGKVGIAFLNDCFTEYEVVDNAERTVALSLIRSVRNWIVTEFRVGSDFPSQKSGQVLMGHTFRYAIRPHSGYWLNADIALAAEAFNTPVRIIQTRQHKGTLPSGQCSLYSIDNPKIRFSTLKKAEARNTFIIRIYNPTGERQEGKIHLHFPFQRAWITMLDEKRVRQIKGKKNREILFVAEPYKIITIEFHIKNNISSGAHH